LKKGAQRPISLDQRAHQASHNLARAISLSLARAKCCRTPLPWWVSHLGMASPLLRVGAPQFDVMDNHFVPNLTIGPMVCKALKNYGIKAPIDVHLMVSPVDAIIGDFADAGADFITFHPEATGHIDRSLSLVRAAGCKSGLVFNPSTSLDVCKCVRPPPRHRRAILSCAIHPGTRARAKRSHAPLPTPCHSPPPQVRDGQDRHHPAHVGQPRLRRPEVHPGHPRQGARGAQDDRRVGESPPLLSQQSCCVLRSFLFAPRHATLAGRAHMLCGQPRPGASERPRRSLSLSLSLTHSLTHSLSHTHTGLAALPRCLRSQGYDISLEIDGGVTADNIKEIAEAGVDMFVAGSAIFGSPDYKVTIDKMRAELAAAKI
jgi:pentose-5-phosphate-3-epimerase